METNQRKRILQNIESLVNLTDFNKLCQACFDNNLLSAIMIQNICHFEPRHILGDNYDGDAIKMERHKRLFIKITKRGPDAFEKLRRIFIALKYKEALNVLFDADESMISISSSKRKGKPITGNEDINQNIIYNNNIVDRQRLVSHDDNEVTLQEYGGLIQPKKNIYVRKATSIIIDHKIPIYPMESKNKRGIFFMVSSDERQQELDEDDHLLLSIFQQLGFKLYAYSNITPKKFFQLLEELLNSDKIIGIECFVLTLRAGGRLIDGVQWITFNDNSVVKVEHIQKYFYHQNCKQLVGKPKIFIFPYSEIANNGVNNLNRVQTDSIGHQGRLKHIAQLSDVINCYATTKGFMDQRDIDNYSRYVQSFVDVVAERACDTHFENMLKLIQDKVAKLSIARGSLQIASYDNISFNRILYLNPGVNLN